MSREIYTKNDLFQGLSNILDDSSFQNILLNQLVNNKIKRLSAEYLEVYSIYENTYIPLIEKNENKSSEEYSISQIMVKKINQTTKKLKNLMKQIAFYESLLNSYDSNKNEVRISRIKKDLKKYMKLLN